MKKIVNRIDWYLSDEKFLAGMLCAIAFMFTALVALRMVDVYLLGGR